MNNQPLDSRQLRAFLAIVRTGSFSVAARELHLSQSAVSHSLRTLEEDVGCRLLDRMGKRVTLTPAGEHLLHHAEKIIQDMSNARQELAQLGQWGVSRLRIGASTTACQHILPAVLRKFKEQFPKCHILIEPGDTPEMIEGLHGNQIDLALALEPIHHEQLDFQSLFHDELAFVVAPVHPWAGQGHATRVEIPRQNYIFYSKNSYTFRMVVNYFAEEEMVLKTVMELGSMEAIKEMVKLGMGVSVLAPWIVRNELREGQLVALPLGRRKLKRNWGVLRWQNKRLSLAEESFIAICRRETEGLGRDFSRPRLREAAGGNEVALTV